MPPDRLPGDETSVPAVYWEPFAAPSGPSSGPDCLDLVVESLIRQDHGHLWPSVHLPFRRPVWLCAIGTSIRGHDVSGTGWQAMRAGIQSITTIRPAWQHGHSRKDRPVSLS